MHRPTWPLALLSLVSIAASLGPTPTVLAQALPACASSAGSVAPPPRLERYDHLVPGARFRVTLRWDAAARAWLPSPALGMPLHHASSLDLGDFVPPADTSTDLELVVTAIERVLVQFDERARTWLYAYRVRVESACVLRSAPPIGS
ncbi:MAG: hypothetical protein U0234_24305 [Sandaracinus sp.]